jgi:hypothetical protein
MKLLSIDVGIKNLALCLFNAENKEKCHILKWDVVSLCNEIVTPCNCGKKALYKYKDIYCCKKHISTTGKELIPKELELSKLKKMKIKELRNILKEYNFIYDDKKSKILLLEYIEPVINEKYVIPFSNKVKATDLSLIDIGINLKQVLDNLYNQHNNQLDNKIDIDCVIIENQISPIANRMKTLQGMIAQYFIMNNVIDIHFISASNKLKDYVDSKNTTYNERKHKGIEICEEIIINSQEFSKHLDVFISSKKKDDLADCFLQGLWYLKDKKLIVV